MMKRAFHTLAVLCLMSASISLAADRIVVGYYPDWSKGSLPPSAIPYASLTHIVHSFLIPAADGTVSGIAAYSTLVQTAHLNNVKVIISLGGWDQSAGFSPMAADTAARHKFVKTMTDFCVNNGYDGVDIDWEYPKNTTDRTNFRVLVHELRQSFDALTPRRSISIAAPSTSWSGQWFDVEGMIGDLDWIGMMTYDYYGSWTTKAGPNSALYGSFSTNTEGWVDYSTSYYLGRSVPPTKLLIGIPLYGWVFSASSMYGASSGASQSAYSAIIPKLDQGWARYWDDQGKVPYMINGVATQVISYDDSLSVAVKCTYINTKGLGGTIVWALGQDKLSDKQPIMAVIGASLRPAAAAVTPGPPSELPAGFAMARNFPNPFNGQTTIRYTIPEAGVVRLTVCDLLGHELRLLVHDHQAAGEHEFHLMGDQLPSGVYFFRLAWQSHVVTRACVVIR
jgi:chitinase